MGSISALKLLDVLENVQHVLAIELLTSAQALDYRAPLRPGRGVELAHHSLREAVPHREQDADFEDDLGRCLTVLQRGSLLVTVEQELGALA